jgi:hypothetical protein
VQAQNSVAAGTFNSGMSCLCIAGADEQVCTRDAISKPVVAKLPLESQAIVLALMTVPGRGFLFGSGKTRHSSFPLSNSALGHMNAGCACLQFAEQVGTEEEYEEELPALRATIQEVLGRQLETLGLDVDAIMAKADILMKLADTCRKKESEQAKQAGATADSIRLDLVRPARIN